MTKRIVNIPKSEKYKPITDDIIAALKEHGKSLELINMWNNAVKLTYSDSDYPYCIVYVANGSFDSPKIPKGWNETITIMIMIEHKAFNEDKTDVMYGFLEDITCALSKGIEFKSSPKYKVKNFVVVDWELTPNTDGSFIFQTLLIQTKATVMICPTCGDDTND